MKMKKIRTGNPENSDMSLSLTVSVIDLPVTIRFIALQVRTRCLVPPGQF